MNEHSGGQLSCGDLDFVVHFSFGDLWFCVERYFFMVSALLVYG